MNLEDLRLFNAVAREGSISGAARALDMPKATLSRRISGFETALGVQLIYRSTRRLTLSEGGRRLLRDTAPLLEELDALGERVQTLQRQPVGSLRLQVPGELFAHDMARLLTRFAADYPGITVHCRHYVGTGFADPEQFDLTLLCYEWRLPPSDWIAVPFLSLRQGIFAAPGTIPGRISPARLQALPALAGVDESLWHFRAGDRVQSVPVQGALELDSPVLRLQAAEQGAGLVKAPVLLADPAVRAGRLEAVDLLHQPVALSVAMFYRSRALPARVRVFTEYLQSHLVPAVADRG